MNAAYQVVKWMILMMCSFAKLVQIVKQGLKY